MITLKLIKVFFRENFQLSRLIGTNVKKNKKKAILLGVVLLYAFGVYLFSFGYLFFEFGKALKTLDSLDVLLQFGFMYGFGISLIIVLFRANGYLFHYKDYEILEPLPIPHRSVIIAKLSVMMILVYLSLAMILSPILFSYFYHAGFHLGKLLIVLIGFLMMPIIPLVVFSFISLIIARITSSFRKSNLLNILAMFLVFIGIMALSLSFSAASSGAGPLPGQQNFISGFASVYLPMQWFVSAVHDLALLDLCWLILSSMALLVGFVSIIQKNRFKNKSKRIIGHHPQTIKNREKSSSFNIYVTSHEGSTQICQRPHLCSQFRIWTVIIGHPEFAQFGISGTNNGLHERYRWCGNSLGCRDIALCWFLSLHCIHLHLHTVVGRETVLDFEKSPHRACQNHECQNDI